MTLHRSDISVLIGGWIRSQRQAGDQAHKGSFEKVPALGVVRPTCQVSLELSSFTLAATTPPLGRPEEKSSSMLVTDDELKINISQLAVLAGLAEGQQRCFRAHLCSLWISFVERGCWDGRWKPTFPAPVRIYHNPSIPPSTLAPKTTAPAGLDRRRCRSEVFGNAMFGVSCDCVCVCVCLAH